MTASLGKYNLSDDSETGSKSHLVSEIVIHPEWFREQSEKSEQHRFQYRFDADVAILLLSEAAIFGLDRNIHPVCLPERSNDIASGIGIVVGWGKTENSSDQYAAILQELKIPVVDDGICYTTFPKLATYSSTRMFCGGFVNQSKALCTGDSGGGFYFLDDDTDTWTIRGIVSGGLVTDTRQCDVNAYTLHTKVATFLDWIKEVMNRTQVVKN